ncbi:MAG: dihydroneopterin aldolase, partial [Alistipes sp.]|nr:dihydroneopterin aldolase [Alistipes sp.]
QLHSVGSVVGSGAANDLHTLSHKIFAATKHQMKITQRTIERVAQNIIGAVKEHFPQIVEVECTVAKLAPPLGGKIGRVSVTLKG